MVLSDLDHRRRKVYIEKTFKGDLEQFHRELNESSTVYVGNLPSTLVEERIWGMFGFCGEVKRVVYGINKTTKTPCGFAFVEYYDKYSADNAVDFFDMYRIDTHFISVNKDIGFTPGRQFGRGDYGNAKKSDEVVKRRMVD